jgi:hypothetical protein
LLEDLQDAGLACDQAAEIIFAHFEDDGVLGRFDGGRALLAGEKRNLTEEIARPEHGEVEPLPRRKNGVHLHRSAAMM